MSRYEVSLAHQLIQFVMKVRSESRPNEMRIKQHLFLKTVSNPFIKDCYDILQRMSGSLNPFIKKKDESDPNSQAAVSLREFKALNSLTEPSQEKGIHPLFFYSIYMLFFGILRLY